MRAIAAVLMAGMMAGQTGDVVKCDHSPCLHEKELRPLTLSECNVAGGNPIMKGDMYAGCTIPPSPTWAPGHPSPVNPYPNANYDPLYSTSRTCGYLPDDETCFHPDDEGEIEVLGFGSPANPDPKSTHYAKLESQDSGTVIRISNAEYAKLQSLRQAVRDEETAIAKAHGVRFGEISTTDSVRPISLDSYEFHGQYLLINVPKE